MREDNNRTGILLMLGATFVFAVQDGLSKHLAGEYNVLMVVMVRYWFFAAFVIAIASRKAGGLRAAATTKHPVINGLRAVLLVAQNCVIIASFTIVGLIETHAVFASSPLIAVALSVPLLGERVGWRRWLAIVIGFVGVLIILEPGFGVFQANALIAMAAALMFALYSLLTRRVSRDDSSTTIFFWTGTVGAVAMTFVGAWFWEPMTAADWRWMGVLCVTGALGHYMLIRCYEVAPVSVAQPFAYFQLAFVSVIGVLVYDESLRINVIVGVILIVAAGLFTLWRQRQLG